ncbi:META domain-containing protein [Rhodobacteraceae bacterium 4F10]|nr:META domain-containing protein [Rhodobacteraceae bacterium 4F10]
MTLRITSILVLGLLLSACLRDETIAGYDNGQTWHLTEMQGKPVDAPVTLSFGNRGKVTGQGPCNGFTAQQSAPLPWIAIDQITATEMSCPDLETEMAFFKALESMTLAELSGDVLLLSNDSGAQLVFRAK